MRTLAASTLLASVSLLAGAAPLLAATHTLAAGTFLPVTFETTVSSATSRPEETVLAKLRLPVRVGGAVVLAGSELRGHVVSARRSGKVKGRAYLSLVFTQLSASGRTYAISARRISLLAPETHGRDAGIIGGGAGAGALVGALADGTSGAAKGAVIGGAAGTGAVLATRGKEVSIRAGSRWRVRLLRPLVLD